MKKTLYFYLITMLFIPIILNAQTEQEKLFIFHVGPYLEAKGGVNTVFIDGREILPAFNGIPDFGASIHFFQVQSFGIYTDIGYNTLSNSYRSYHFKEKKGTEHYGYFSIKPSLYLGGVFLGVNIMVPVSAYYKFDDGGNITDEDIDTGVLSTVIELNVGGIIPLFENDKGVLNLIIRGGYSMTGIFDSYGKDAPLGGYAEIPYVDKSGFASPMKDYDNPQPASLSVGLSYLFKIY